jgi:hypothetical protein
MPLNLRSSLRATRSSEELRSDGRHLVESEKKVCKSTPTNDDERPIKANVSVIRPLAYVTVSLNALYIRRFERVGSGEMKTRSFCRFGTAESCLLIK